MAQQYFVVLEDTKELRWQTELLFESIRLLDLQDDFVIAICPEKGSIVRRHKYSNAIYFDNVGKKLGFPKFNKCYGLGKAIESGILKQPFVVLDPDMFLLQRIPSISSPVSAQESNDLSWDKVASDIKSFTSHWIEVGGIYYFNNVPMKVFEDIIKYSYDLYIKLGNLSKTHIYGFTLGILKNDLKIQKINNYEMPLFYDGSPNTNWQSYVVHYKNGCPPYFDKEKVYNSINFSFNTPLPFKTILEIPVKNQPNVAIMQTLIRSWLDFNSERINDLL